MMQFICYPKCTTCQKAKKWLETNGISYEERHIKEKTRPLKNSVYGSGKAVCR